jgi:hypothetical protein
LSDAACCLVLPDFSISRPWLPHIYTMFEASLPFFPFLFSHRRATVDTHARLDDDGAPAISSRPMLQDCWMIDTTCCSLKTITRPIQPNITARRYRQLLVCRAQALRPGAQPPVVRLDWRSLECTSLPVWLLVR